MNLWPAIGATVLGCYAFKLAGTLVPLRLLDRPTVARMALLVPVALLASITAVQTVTTGQRLVVDARLAGVAVAATAALLRAL
ncbi:MAG TPA: AzlD domain-containing protein [Mycobacteriales bacterium]|nr:AzlD domain-containing protein [Mycobacteriales bacterium]